jgi:hypothetical protein
MSHQQEHPEIISTSMDVDYLSRPQGVKTYDRAMQEAGVLDRIVIGAPPRDSCGEGYDKHRPIPFASGKWGTHEHVTISESGDEVTFKLQHGPFVEVGCNGTYVDDIILFAKEMLVEFNKNRPSRETSMVITKLDEALLWNFKRAAERHFAGVQGTGQQIPK